MPIPQIFSCNRKRTLTPVQGLSTQANVLTAGEVKRLGRAACYQVSSRAVSVKRLNTLPRLSGCIDNANPDGLRQKFYQMLLSDIFPSTITGANDLQNAFTSAYNGKDIRALGKPHFDYRQNCKEDGFIPQPEGINFLLDK
ncbi:10900_t:CDS:2, partial [Paraglomus occultum]